MDRPKRPVDLGFDELTVFGILIVVGIACTGAAAVFVVARLVTHLW